MDPKEDVFSHIMNIRGILVDAFCASKDGLRDCHLRIGKHLGIELYDRM